MNKGFQIALASFAITTALIKGAPALAEPAPAQNVSIVRTADLDLSSDAGRRALDQRLAIAAREVCGTASDADLAGKNEVRDCRDKVLAEARAKSESLVAHRGGGEIVLVASIR